MTLAAVTLAVPMYRSAAFLPGLFEILRRCTPMPAEIVFLDDASPDESFALASRFAATFTEGPAIRVLRNEHNLGIAGTYNRLVQEAAQPWVHVLDADDYPVEADYYARLRPALEGSDGLVVTALSSNSKLLTWGNAALGWAVPRRPPHWWPLLGSFATRSGVLYRRELVQAHGFLDPAYPGSDVIHFLRLRALTGCRYVSGCHLHYRIHANATSSQARDFQPYRQALRAQPRSVRWAYRFDLWLRERGQRSSRRKDAVTQ